MASIYSRARATALTALVGVLAAQSAFAADMPFLSSPPVAEQPVEFGSGWYLRGDVGYSNQAAPAIIADFANSLGRTGSVSGGLGFGYQYNSWLRTDVTIDRTVFRPGGPQASIWCPSGTIVTYPAGNANLFSPPGPAGYLYNPNETCTPVVTSSFDRTSPMFNAYLDLGNWWGLTPYVGAGVGVSYMQTHASSALYQNWNGQLWGPNLGVSGVPLGWVTANGFTQDPILPIPTAAPLLTWVANYITPPRALVFQQLAQGQSLQKKSWKFSWNLMAGVSYDLTQNIKVDLHYRFFDAGSYTGLMGFSGAPAITKDLTSQEVRLGVRLTSD